MLIKEHKNSFYVLKYSILRTFLYYLLSQIFELYYTKNLCFLKQLTLYFHFLVL